MSAVKEGSTKQAELRRRAASPAATQSTASSRKSAPEEGSAACSSKTMSSRKCVLTRTVQGFLLLGTRMVQQSMRNALSPLLVFMSKELQISTSQKGTLLSAIAAGYFFTQVPGGALADKLGAKNVMTVSLLLSAACCLVIPACVDTLGMSGLWVVMAVMGAVQGPLFPTSTVYLSRWMPAKVEGGTDEKAWGTSMLDIGISVGALLVIPVSNSLAGALGWRLAYQTIGALSIAFVILWQILAAEEPRRCFYISKDELEFLEANVVKPESKKSKVEVENVGECKQSSPGVLGVPPKMSVHPGLWAVFIAHITFNYGAYYLTNWSPTYYADVLHVPPEEAKLHLMMPHITNLAAKALNPMLVSFVEKLGFGLLDSRRIFTVSGFLLAGACLLPVHQLRDYSPWVSTALFSATNAFFGLAPSGFKANYLDITEKYVGVISGYGNTLGTVASWVGPQFVAMLLQRFESWDIVLISVTSMNCLAALYYARYATVTPLEKSIAAGEAPFLKVKALDKQG